MQIIDKKRVIESLQKDGAEPITLELGCGNCKRIQGSVGVDMLDYDAVDIVGDVYAVLRDMPSESVDAVYSSHFFEHVDDLSKLLDEIARVLVPGGVLEIIVPHFSNPYFYSDYTHRVFYGLYSFSYFATDKIFSRKTPTYQKQLQYELQDVRLGFKSSRSFPLRYGFKKVILEPIFNLGNWMKEFYEENLCYLFPCYELKFVLRKRV